MAPKKTSLWIVDFAEVKISYLLFKRERINRYYCTALYYAIKKVAEDLLSSISFSGLLTSAPDFQESGTFAHGVREDNESWEQGCN